MALPPRIVRGSKEPSRGIWIHAVTCLALAITVRQTLIHQLFILKLKCQFQYKTRRSMEEKKYYEYYFCGSNTP